MSGDATVGNADEIGPFFESDILLTEAQKADGSRNGLVNPMVRWPGGRIPYIIYSEVPENYTARLNTAFASVRTNTKGCIDFVPKELGDRNYINITGYWDWGCYSYIGVVGGVQSMNFPEWCIDEPAIIVHELLHAIGFYHMQSDRERDDHVIINWEHIIDGTESNFFKNDNTDKFDTDYEYGSIMHYSQYAFSKDGNATITTKDPAMQEVIGQRVNVTQDDYFKVMRMYEEAGQCKF